MKPVMRKKFFGINHFKNLLLCETKKKIISNFLFSNKMFEVIADAKEKFLKHKSPCCQLLPAIIFIVDG